MSFKLPLVLLVAIASATPSLARAGASLYVDDASVTPRGHCQVESWMRGYAPGNEFSSVPACNYRGTEFGLGVNYFSHPAHGPIVNLGVKRAFHDFDTQRWGIAASLGASWDSARGQFDGWSANVPVSVALDGDRHTVVHANLGWSKLRHVRGKLTRGIGIEHSLSAHWTLLGEAYADHATIAQLGVRRAFGDNASLDLLAGRQGGTTPASWLTLGFNIVLAN